MTHVDATIAELDAAPSRPGNGPRTATDEDVLLRLALWLAEVAAEAALAGTAPAASPTRAVAAPQCPPVVEPAR